MECVYCSNSLDENNSSKEHIIHNALGGLLESCGICCKKCNETLGEKADASFTRLFAPITESMNIKRTRETAPVKYNAVVCDMDGNTYKAQMKGNKIWNVFSDNGEYLNNSIDLNSLRPIELTFEVDNIIFKNGFKKIAFNFAVHCGIDPQKLDFVYDAGRKCLRSDTMSNVIPFIPLNFFDRSLENTEVDDLTHALILFSYENMLVAYIELFSTFQFYVVLSEKWDGEEVYFNYLQCVEKRTFNEENAKKKLKVHDYKDMMIIADQYGLEYTTDFLAIEREAFHKLRKRSYEIDLLEYILEQTYKLDPLKDICNGNSHGNYIEYMYYFVPETEMIDESGDTFTQCEGINKARFRISNISNGKVDFYIRAIIENIKRDGFDKLVKPYTYSKMRRLTEKLFEHDP